MDRSRRRSGLLIAACALAVGAAGPADPTLRAIRWLPAGGDVARLLTQTPPECLTPPKDVADAYLVEVGRAAFRDPLLLGGQAARAGLSCETCHQNGRANAQFDFPGVSGAPGTADVTTFLFSTHRGDHIDNPRPIPDLGGSKAALKVSQVRRSGALERFIAGLVTEEFEGPRPPAAVLEGLATYVRALDPSSCPPNPSAPLTVSAAIDTTLRAARAAASALARGDQPTAVVMLQAARAQLGSIAERYPGPVLSADRRGLAVADLDLVAVLVDVRAGRTGTADDVAAWLARSPAWIGPLERDQSQSLYDRRTLARALGTTSVSRE